MRAVELWTFIDIQTCIFGRILAAIFYRAKLSKTSKYTRYQATLKQTQGSLADHRALQIRREAE